MEGVYSIQWEDSIFRESQPTEFAKSFFLIYQLLNQMTQNQMTAKQKQLWDSSDLCTKTKTQFLKSPFTKHPRPPVALGGGKAILISFLISQALFVHAETIDFTGMPVSPVTESTFFGTIDVVSITPNGRDITFTGDFSPIDASGQPVKVNAIMLGGNGSYALNISNFKVSAQVNNLAAKAVINGNADSNQIVIDGASSDLSLVRDMVVGASLNGSANGNSLIINGDSPHALPNLVGGSSASGEASHNQIIITGNITATSIHGGHARSRADDNTITITGNGSIFDLYGGYGLGGGVASSNKIDLTYTGTINSLSGGYASDEAIGNIVKIHSNHSQPLGLTVTILSGGSAGISNNNVVVIDKDTKIEAERVYAGLYHGLMSNTIETSNNSLTIYGGSNFNDVGGGISLGAFDKTQSNVANNNTVTIDAAGVSINDYVVGGAGYTANFNQVTLKQAYANKVLGGQSTADGEFANKNRVFIENAKTNIVAGGLGGKEAIENQVFINNATVTAGGSIYGGYVYGAKGENASQNLVYVSGNTTVDGDVYGAYSENPNVQTISQNSVTLDGNVKVTGGIYAAAVAGQGNIGDKNELVFRGKTSAGTIGGFTDLHLLVSEENTLTSNNEYVLTLTGANSLDLTGKNIDIYDFRNNASAPNGEKFGLIKVANAQGGTSPAIQLGGNVTLHNTFVDKNWEVKNDSVGELYLQGESLIIQPPTPNDPNGPVVIAPSTTANLNSESLSQNRLSSIGLANQSAQFAVDSGLSAMKDQLSGKNWFFVGEGGTNKYGHGFNKVELNGGSVITGMMNNFNGTLLGGFFEASWGHAGSKESVFSAKSNIQSYGIGILASREIYPNWEVNGSLRFGWMRNSFKGRYFDVNGSSDFKTNMPYASAHIGTAYNFPVSETTTISPYARYIVSYLGSDKVNAGDSENDRYKANANVSHTLRAGVKVKTQFAQNFLFVGGLAVDETMGAKAKGRISGYDLKTLSVNGTTGVGELKLQATPSSTSPWKFEVGVKGYAGKRRGVSGEATVNYTF